jgi:hypothetical protein
MLDFTSLTDWQWAGLVGIALVSLALGGILRRNSSQDQGPHHPGAELPFQDLTTPQLEAELKDAREEAELTLLQLHQVQEELEHYFLESRDLQQKLDQFETTSKTAQQNELRDDQVALLQSLKLRIHNLILEKNSKRTNHSDPERLEVMLLRQQALLRRCSQLLKNQHRFNKAQQKPSPDQDTDLVFL